MKETVKQLIKLNMNVNVCSLIVWPDESYNTQHDKKHISKYVIRFLKYKLCSSKRLN